ncbi:hypothetical protein IFM89_000537 [Coptis chinensis]|uniref:Uncharacterized protein n=1 Tax=Coptis chinensis TaxID=261450 RepID=A0A835LFX0_9MAGN|nr:hypothetical protein IFM89_000537 [Coptis chinensis]
MEGIDGYHTDMNACRPSFTSVAILAIFLSIVAGKWGHPADPIGRHHYGPRLRYEGPIGKRVEVFFLVKSGGSQSCVVRKKKLKKHHFDSKSKGSKERSNGFAIHVAFSGAGISIFREGLESCHGEKTVARWAKCTPRHLIGRLRKAVKWATLFADLCGTKGNSGTSLEAKQNSMKLGAGEDLYALFAGILTMRPWNRVIDPAADQLVIKGNGQNSSKFGKAILHCPSEPSPIRTL